MKASTWVADVTDVFQAVALKVFDGNSGAMGMQGSSGDVFGVEVLFGSDSELEQAPPNLKPSHAEAQRKPQGPKARSYHFTPNCENAVLSLIGASLSKQAVGQLHVAGVCHGDLTLQNMLRGLKRSIECVLLIVVVVATTM